MVNTPHPTPVLPDDVVEEVAQYCRLLSESTRLRIMMLLAIRGDYHVSGLCQELSLNQPAVSHHLSILRDAGMLEMRREGRHNYYALIREPLCDVVKNLIRGTSNGTNSFQLDGLSVRVKD